MLQKEKVKARRRSPGIRADEVREAIEKKAYELYEKRGREPGHDLGDWLEAEKPSKTARKT